VACTQDPLACFAGAGYHIHRLVSHASYLHTGHFCRLLSFAGTTAQSQLPDLENQWLTAGCISLMFLGHPQVGENIVLTTEEPWANWQVPICHDKLGTSMFSHVVLPMPIIWKFALETLPRTKSPNALHLLPSHPFPGSCTSSQTPRRRYPHINKRPSPPKFSNNSRPEHNYEDNGGSIQGAPRRSKALGLGGRDEHGILPIQIESTCRPPEMRYKSADRLLSSFSRSVIHTAFSHSPLEF
jgi:hypothetical protein